MEQKSTDAASRANTRRFAVTAASGKLGRAITAALEKQGFAANTRLACRNPQKIGQARAAGFEIVQADYEDGKSMAKAFAGMETALIISSIGTNVTRIRQHHIAIDAAIAAGVKHIIYMSAVLAPQAHAFAWMSAHNDTETYLRKTGVAYTILRVGPYFSNFDYLFLQARECGVFFFPNIHAPAAFITQEDVAAAAIETLSDANHQFKTYNIVGQHASTGIELASILTRVTDRPVHAADMPVEEFTKQFQRLKLPDYMVTTLSGFYTALSNGAYGQISAETAMLIGRAPTSATDYLRDMLVSTPMDIQVH